MAGSDFTTQLTAVLQQYTGAVMDKVDAAVETCGKGMTKEIRNNSPKRTGDYKKGWRCEITTNGRGAKSARTFNKDRFQLTHLLENRHRKRGHKGWKEPHPHIGPEAEKWKAKFLQQCEEACTPK